MIFFQRYLNIKIVIFFLFIRTIVEKTRAENMIGTLHIKPQKIALGADHAGFELKEILKKHLESGGYQVVDCGTNSTDPVDYPVIAYKVARLVAEETCDSGIMVDAAGIGSAMAANKVKGIRAAACYDLTTARNSREHNDANVLTLGAGLTAAALAKQIVDVWLNSSCTVERYLKRVRQIHQIEAGNAPDADNPAERPDNQNNAIQTDHIEEATQKMTDLQNDDLQKIVERIESLLKDEFGVSLQDVARARDMQIMDGRGVGVEKNSSSMQDFINLGVGRMTSTLGNGQDIPKEIAKYIDHTLLRPDATPDDIKKLCQEALQYEFASVCVNPTYVKLAAGILRGSPVKVCSVVGFPFGTHTPEVKAFETRQAIRNGAKEIDMVINIGALKAGDEELLYRDIRSVTEACEDGGALSKVIIETALLTDEEKVKACQIARKARADYVKTSTGFASGGATAHDVALMHEAVKGTKMGVKASGGIRSYADMQKMIQAGATRIGASAGIQIVKEAKGLTESN